MEQIEIFDETYKKVKPFCASIDDVHKHGLWHQTFACWLVNKKENVIYLQLRGPKNKVGANTFDASSSGHLSYKEPPQKGFRELKEELGKNIKIENKKFLGVFRNIFISKNYINREFCNVFIANTKNNIEDFVLQEGEVFGIFKLNIDDGIKLFSKEIKSTSIMGKIFDNKKYKNTKRKISIKDFNLYKDREEIFGYYLKVVIMAKRYVENKMPVRI